MSSNPDQNRVLDSAIVKEYRVPDMSSAVRQFLDGDSTLIDNMIRAKALCYRDGGSPREILAIMQGPEIDGEDYVTLTLPASDNGQRAADNMQRVVQIKANKLQESLMMGKQRNERHELVKEFTDADFQMALNKFKITDDPSHLNKIARSNRLKFAGKPYPVIEIFKSVVPTEKDMYHVIFRQKPGEEQTQLFAKYPKLVLLAKLRFQA